MGILIYPISILFPPHPQVLQLALKQIAHIHGGKQQPGGDWSRKNVEDSSNSFPKNWPRLTCLVVPWETHSWGCLCLTRFGAHPAGQPFSQWRILKTITGNCWTLSLFEAVDRSLFINKDSFQENCQNYLLLLLCLLQNSLAVFAFYWCLILSWLVLYLQSIVYSLHFMLVRK